MSTDEDGRIEWWEEYKVLWRKFELDVGSVGRLKNKIKTMRRTGKKKYARKAH